jgi:hypothetical protein
MVAPAPRRALCAAAVLLLCGCAAAAGAGNVTNTTAVPPTSKAHGVLSSEWTTDLDVPTTHNLTVPLSSRPVVLGHEEVPAHVYFTFETVRLANVDVLKGTFTLDGYVHVAWRDDRLRAAPLSYADGATLDKTLFSDCINSCMHRQPVLWTPQPEVVNDGTGVLDIGLDHTLSYTPPAWMKGDEVNVDLPTSNATPTAWVSAESRLFVELTADFNMRDFPFDWHDVGLLIESRSEHFKDLRWVPCASLSSALLPPTEVAGWTVLGAGSENRDKYHPIDDNFFSQLHLYVRLTRQPNIYNIRFTLGSALLTLMAIVTLLMKPDDLDRMSFANTCFLGIVSWQFILVSSTPALGYATRMDVFLVVSLVFITAVYLWHAVHAGFRGTVDEATAPVAGVSLASPETPKGDILNGNYGDELPSPTNRLMRVLNTIDSWGHSGHGYWANIGVHRKLDLIVFVVLSVGYTVVSAVILGAWLDRPVAPGINRNVMS